MTALVADAHTEIKKNLRSVACSGKHRILTADEYITTKMDELERHRQAHIVRKSIMKNQTPVMSKLTHLKHSLLELVLGEALTNAFCHASENRFQQEFVSVVFSTCPNYCIIIIRNTTDLQNIFEKKVLPISKEDYGLHGYGSGIIDDIIQKDFSGQVDRKITPNEKIDLVSILNFGS